jgi:DNA-binding LacI/PurR family transcriptional regulator
VQPRGLVRKPDAVTGTLSAATSADVARLAGVSRATVSLVLNGHAKAIRISDQTRTRVTEVAEQLRYTPNHAARSLRRRSTKLLSFVLPTLDNPYFSEVVGAAQLAAQAHGYSVSVIPSRNDLAPFDIASILQSAACDGIIMAGHDNCGAADLGQLVERGVAVVVLQEKSSDPRIYSVSVDLEAGGYLATQHLIGLGHRSIAHVTERLRPDRRRHDRLDGYRRALREAGIGFDPRLVVTTANSMAGGAEALDCLMERADNRPTAAFLYNDQLAVGALHALRKRGMTVPRDFAVVGFDGVAVGAFTAPPLTTIDHPREELGRLAIEMLVAAIGGFASGVKNHLLPIKLVVRGSCGGDRALDTA